MRRPERSARDLYAVQQLVRRRLEYGKNGTLHLAVAPTHVVSRGVAGHLNTIYFSGDRPPGPGATAGGGSGVLQHLDVHPA